ncbi:hypothetical protein B0T14DRAFT_153666 [Immersiella caudata]|uniref:Uncharacterized protein n=1 Tax=Immersiella caudata TaxID=314043 RepID=A0AA39WX13_9PEZI|nr:hypothetical protein B0T14DRAFT_153666 [Immersiella caudata]
MRVSKGTIPLSFNTLARRGSFLTPLAICSNLTDLPQTEFSDLFLKPGIGGNIFSNYRVNLAEPSIITFPSPETAPRQNPKLVSQQHVFNISLTTVPPECLSRPTAEPKNQKAQCSVSSPCQLSDTAKVRPRVTTSEWFMGTMGSESDSPLNRLCIVAPFTGPKARATRSSTWLCRMNIAGWLGSSTIGGFNKKNKQRDMVPTADIDCCDLCHPDFDHIRLAYVKTGPTSWNRTRVEGQKD